MRSAIEQQLVGCPVPASDVDFSESIRSRVATFFRAGMREERSRDMRLSIVDCGLPDFKAPIANQSAASPYTAPARPSSGAAGASHCRIRPASRR